MSLSSAMRSYGDIIQKRYLLVVTCPKCGQQRRAKTVSIPKFKFICFSCGKYTSLRAYGKDNCKYQIL